MKNEEKCIIVIIFSPCLGNKQGLRDRKIVAATPRSHKCDQYGQDRFSRSLGATSTQGTSTCLPCYWLLGTLSTALPLQPLFAITNKASKIFELINKE